MAKEVYTILSGKGGVGKTMVTSNLGVALSLLGYKTCVVDGDVSLANLELFYGMENMPVTLQDVLAGNASLNEAIYEGPAGVLVVPAGLTMDYLKKTMAQELDGIIVSLLDWADIVLIDAPAGVDSRYVLMSLYVSPKFLVVINPEITSIVDGFKAKKVGELLNSKPVGVVINKLRKNSKVGKKDIERTFGVRVLATIPEDPRVSVTVEKGVPYVLKYPNSPVTREIFKLASNLLDLDINVVLKAPKTARRDKKQ